VCIKYVVEVQILNENKFLAFWIKAGSLLCEPGSNSETFSLSRVPEAILDLEICKKIIEKNFGKL
jgi:hypothetical protein